MPEELIRIDDCSHRLYCVVIIWSHYIRGRHALPCMRGEALRAERAHVNDDSDGVGGPITSQTAGAELVG